MNLIRAEAIRKTVIRTTYVLANNTAYPHDGCVDSAAYSVRNKQLPDTGLYHVGQVEFHSWLPAGQLENLVHILSSLSILTY